MRARRTELAEKAEKMLAGVRSAGLKLTPQRIAIVKELASHETHPTAQELSDRLRVRAADDVVRHGFPSKLCETLMGWRPIDAARGRQDERTRGP
jgi:hypothetical protein